jgi:hypothetical protein
MSRPTHHVPLFLIANGVQEQLRFEVRSLVGIADGHSWKTQTHALVQHANIMIEGIISCRFDLELFTSTASH